MSGILIPKRAFVRLQKKNHVTSDANQFLSLLLNVIIWWPMFDLVKYENLKELKCRIETPYGVFVTNPNPRGGVFAFWPTI